ncbi:IPT/TIG domain-containing protein [Catalinimonas alkaloidigena]|uniref:IPT/TIG domain-containing protein n=1 Tax=Catalinimonas alkaloidigena TaxID=1075417 RepID=A0A1G9LLG6_9BACT|nr:IPT/TIG domain-containing protein [Catalinimonas alkaloidigena]SDL62704.1 IPT/TIG domain-containing protein [Catalinimonas alkaloidigena]
MRTNSTLNRIYDIPGEIVDSIRLEADDVVISPQITSFAPQAGRPGSLVLIHGMHFSTLPGENTVRFQGETAEVLSVSDTLLQVRVPSTARTGRLEVETRHGAGGSDRPFEVYLPPQLQSVTP